MYGYPTVTRRLSDRAPALCIFAEGVPYRASLIVSARSSASRPPAQRFSRSTGDLEERAVSKCTMPSWSSNPAASPTSLESSMGVQPRPLLVEGQRADEVFHLRELVEEPFEDTSA